MWLPCEIEPVSSLLPEQVTLLLLGCMWFKYHDSRRTASRTNLYESLVVSILSYGRKTLTMLTDVECKAFEMKCLWRLIHISYREQKSSECVRRLVTILIGPDEPLLAKVKRRKMVWSMSLGDTLPKDSSPEMGGVRKSTRQAEKKGE